MADSLERVHRLDIILELCGRPTFRSFITLHAVLSRFTPEVVRHHHLGSQSGIVDT